jgi:uncharacterized phage protein gp47/JayE
MAGLDATGFTPKTLDEIKEELESSIQATWGAHIDVSPEEPIGQIVGIVCEPIASVWDALAALHAAFNPDTAEGLNLDAIAAITGTVRREATKSRVTARCTGDAGTVIAAGRIFAVEGSGHRFYTLADATIGGGGTVDVLCEAEEYGPIPVYVGTLTQIETPVLGLDSVTNLATGELGRNIETDADLRLRREAELHSSGFSALEAIRTHVSKVTGVSSVTVFENTSMFTDADGIPAKAFEVLVQGGADADIREAIWESKPAGILAHGSVTGTVTDSQGTVRTVKFSRPTTRPIWIIASVIKDANAYPVDGDAQVEAAIIAYGLTLGTGRDVVSSALVAACFTVAGVLDAAVLIGLADPPTSPTTVSVNLREIAVFDANRITVSSATGTP